MILDGGACEVGLESTVVSIERNDQDFYQLSILRAGQVTQSEIEQSLTPKFEFKFVAVSDKKSAPGQMKHHYMPEIPLILVKNSKLSEKEILEQTKIRLQQLPDEIDSVQIRKPTELNHLVEMILPKDAALSARKLYSELRSLAEREDSQAIFFRLQNYHESEDWIAAIDRLKKAASLILDKNS